MDSPSRFQPRGGFGHCAASLIKVSSELFGTGKESMVPFSNSSRPNLATGQISDGVKSHTILRQVRFDWVIVAKDEVRVEIEHSSIPPKHIQKS
jgi:hypothetical protein